MSGVDRRRALIDMACPCEVCLHRNGLASGSTGWCYMFERRPKLCRKFESDREAMEQFSNG